MFSNKRRLFALLFLLVAIPVQATITAGQHVFAQASSVQTITTASIDTTGCTLLVAVLNGQGGDTWPATPITDNKSNVWHGLTLRSASGDKVQIWYSYTGNVGTGHTFTMSITNASGYFNVAASGWKGTATDSTVFDVETGNAACSPSTSCAPGSLSPAVSGEVAITGTGSDDSPSALTVDTATSGFNIIDSARSGEYFGTASKIDAASAAFNPTWTMTGNTDTTAPSAMAAFKPISVPATSACTLSNGVVFSNGAKCF